MRKIILLFIRFYQKIFSLDHGFISYVSPKRFCRFYPSCSEYTYQSIKHFGLRRGIVLGIKRVVRCHPWNNGGYDPIPKD